MKSFAENNKVSIEYLIIDGLILTIFCYIGIVANLRPDNIIENGFPLLAVIYLGWLVSAAITRKFIPVMFPTKKLKAFEFKVKFYLWFVGLIVISLVFVNIGFKQLCWFYQSISRLFIIVIIGFYVFVCGKERK